VIDGRSRTNSVVAPARREHEQPGDRRHEQRLRCHRRHDGISSISSSTGRTSQQATHAVAPRPPGRQRDHEERADLRDLDIPPLREALTNARDPATPPRAADSNGVARGGERRTTAGRILVLHPVDHRTT
jgi:hypothetical protein